MTRIGRTDLPVAVRDLAARLGVQSPPPKSIVTLTQSGRMRRKLGSPAWMSFSAHQSIATDTCNFAWKARFGALGMIAVRDMLDNDGAHLAVTAFGVIPIARVVPSRELTRGELMRYLGEIALAPDAILANVGLRWQADGPDRLVVGSGEGEAAADVTLNLDSGRIGSIFAPDRPRSVAESFIPTPWSGHFSDYRQHRDRWLPFAADVSWDVNGRTEIYLEAQIKSWSTSTA